MDGFIYIISNDINDNKYIGQTIQSLKERFYRHCQYYGSDAEKRMVIKMAIHKYGRSHFKISLLEKCKKEQLDDREKFYIEKYNSFKKGYNSTIGGQIGHKDFKLSESDFYEIKKLYTFGFSLRAIAKEYNVDKATIKNLLIKNGEVIKKVREYKLTTAERKQIVNLVLEGKKRKDIINLYKISKSYLSQLINGVRRI